MKHRIIYALLFISFQAYSQNDSLKKWNISAYGELYYSYDFSNPQNHERANYIYNHKRHNEVNVNLILINANYTDNYYRANLGLMAGNYAKYNLATEPTWAQFIYEANMGILLSKKQNIWLEAGILPSHIGFESAVSADCLTLTRSLMAENSPYYETGVKLNYTSKNEKLSISALYLNGWQKISKPNFTHIPSFGTQLNYKPSEKLLFNYSTFFGTDKPDSLNAFRQFHNFYLQYKPSKTLGITAGFDIGADRLTYGTYGIWYSPVIIVKISVTPKASIALRGEYYHDQNEIIITTNTPNGFQTVGFSTNFDFDVNNKIKCRIEAKMFHSKDQLYQNQNRNQNYSFTTSMSIKI